MIGCWNDVKKLKVFLNRVLDWCKEAKKVFMNRCWNDVKKLKVFLNKVLEWCKETKSFFWIGCWNYVKKLTVFLKLQYSATTVSFGTCNIKSGCPFTFQRPAFKVAEVGSCLKWAARVRCFPHSGGDRTATGKSFKGTISRDSKDIWYLHSSCQVCLP